jgi:amino acid transporter
MEINKFKKDSLSIFETIALSVAIMGPSASIAMIVGMMASFTGYSAPLVFLISMLVVGITAISIAKLNQYFPSSGSVYSFVEKSLGKRAGFISGWLIVFAYLMLGISCAAVACSYLRSIIEIFGINIHWIVIELIILLLIWFLARKDAKTSTGMMLALEVVSMSLIVILSGIILFKASKTSGLSMVPFQIGNNSISSIANAVVFGFLAFSGFEGASSLGEESKNPKKTIPIAIASTVIITGLFYIFVSYAQVIGFGTTPGGIKALAGNQAPLGFFAKRYLGSGVSIAVLLCISISFFSSTLGCVSAGARILFTMGRDRMLSGVLTRTHKKYSTPFVGLNIYIAAIALILLLCFRLEPIEVGGYAAMLGTLTLISSYIITTIGAVVFFYKNRIWRGFKLIIPILSILILSFILYSNIYPMPEYPMKLFPYIVITWLIIGILLCNRRLSSKNSEID